MSRTNDEDEVSEALLYGRPEPDFEAGYAFAPDGTAAMTSTVQPIWKRVQAFILSTDCLYSAY
jgi:hypothetical protein